MKEFGFQTDIYEKQTIQLWVILAPLYNLNLFHRISNFVEAVPKRCYNLNSFDSILLNITFYLQVRPYFLRKNTDRIESLRISNQFIKIRTQFFKDNAIFLRESDSKI